LPLSNLQGGIETSARFARGARASLPDDRDALGEDLFELGWDEAALRVVHARVAAVLGAVAVLEEDAEERVWEEARRREPREEEVDDAASEERERAAVVEGQRGLEGEKGEGESGTDLMANVHHKNE